MAETNTRIMNMVRRELDKDPSMASEALYEKAKKIDSGIANLNVRQFHARYPLQVKRAQANARKGRGGRPAATKAAATGRRRGRPPGTGKRAARRGRPPSAAKKTAAKKSPGRPRGRPPGRRAASAPRAVSGSGADAVRNLLLQFARDVAAAEGKADVVDVIGSVDGWVDRVMAAAK